MLVLVSLNASAWTFEAEVVGVSDGDTVTIVTPRPCHPLRAPCKAGKVQYKVRLAQIDTPEKKQPWGDKARQALADRVFRKHVEVEVMDVDRYGRLVANLFLPKEEARDEAARWVNADMVQSGHAWVYRKYLVDESLLNLEEAARKAGRGLWGLPEARRQPPWEWRAEQRKQKK